VKEKYRKHSGYRKFIKGRKKWDLTDGQVPNEKTVDIEKPKKVAERNKPFGGLGGFSCQRKKRENGRKGITVHRRDNNMLSRRTVAYGWKER
jgi:hypothetical protein